MTEQNQVFDKSEVLKFVGEVKKMCQHYPNCYRCPWGHLDCEVGAMTLEHIERLEEHVNKLRRYEEAKSKFPA